VTGEHRTKRFHHLLSIHIRPSWCGDEKANYSRGECHSLGINVNRLSPAGTPSEPIAFPDGAAAAGPPRPISVGLWDVRRIGERQKRISAIPARAVEGTGA
jgi:hypothetical protein